MTHLEIVNRKIVDWHLLGQLANRWRFAGKKIVFTNGCFDILHLGHIDYLSKAADMGDVLIIGINTDASVSGLKGTHRPITDERSRITLVASLQFVSALSFFEQQTPLELIEVVRPDVLVKGADYTIDKIAGADFVQSYGGVVHTIPLLEGYSTTSIEKKIKQTV